MSGNNSTTNDNSSVATNSTGNYTATRTSTDGSYMGMSSSTWTWIIMGIAAIAIIALVWYYSMQLTEKNYDEKN
jgi:hypothetical protein